MDKCENRRHFYRPGAGAIRRSRSALVSAAPTNFSGNKMSTKPAASVRNSTVYAVIRTKLAFVFTRTLVVHRPGAYVGHAARIYARTRPRVRTQFTKYVRTRFNCGIRKDAGTWDTRARVYTAGRVRYEIIISSSGDAGERFSSRERARVCMSREVRLANSVLVLNTEPRLCIGSDCPWCACARARATDEFRFGSISENGFSQTERGYLPPHTHTLLSHPRDIPVSQVAYVSVTRRRVVDANEKCRPKIRRLYVQTCRGRCRYVIETVPRIRRARGRRKHVDKWGLLANNYTGRMVRSVSGEFIFARDDRGVLPVNRATRSCH